MSAPEEWVVVALGSNLGDSVKILTGAMDRLEKRSVKPLRRSSLWKTAPFNCPPGAPDYLNAVVVMCPGPEETPESLLDYLLKVECEFGRVRSGVVNEARTLDLDLIAFGNQRRNSAHLHLPHPRAAERRFVLGPLAELSSDFTLPGQNESVSQQLARLPEDESP